MYTGPNPVGDMLGMQSSCSMKRPVRTKSIDWNVLVCNYEMLLSRPLALLTPMTRMSDAFTVTHIHINPHQSVICSACSLIAQYKERSRQWLQNIHEMIYDMPSALLTPTSGQQFVHLSCTGEQASPQMTAIACLTSHTTTYQHDAILVPRVFLIEPGCLQNQTIYHGTVSLLLPVTDYAANNGSAIPSCQCIAHKSTYYAVNRDNRLPIKFPCSCRAS